MPEKLIKPSINFFIVATFVISSLLCSSPIYAANTQDTITAVYLYKLADNIKWPNQGSNNTFHFHIVSKNKNIYQAMQGVARLKKLHGKAITVSHSSSAEIPQKSKVVFVSEAKTDLFAKIFAGLEGRPVLVVSEALTNKRLVMINIFQTTDKRMQFQINKANILNQNLGIHPDIILLGGTEIDVAKLYKEGQHQLSKQSQRLALLQKDITSIKNEKETLKNILEAKKRKVGQWTVQLAEARENAKVYNDQLIVAHNEVEQLQKTTTQQKKKIQQQLDKLLISTKQLKQKQSELNTQQAKLNAQQAELNTQQAEIDKRSDVLLKQADDIKKQDAIISKHKMLVTEIETALAGERQRFIFLSFIAALIFLLSILLFVGNRRKKKTNKILYEQKQQLQESEEKYRTLYDKAPGLMTSVEVDTRKIVECNEILLQKLGYSRDEVIGKEIFEFYHPDSVQAAREVFEHFLATDEFHEAELQLAKKDGSKIDVLLDVSVRMDKRTGKKYTLSIWRDITSHKKAEKDILLAKEALESVNKQLKELDQLKSMFIASMSHELRTPLNSIIGFSGLMLKEIHGELNEQYKDYNTRVHRAGKHLLDLISDVIDISKIEAGRVDVSISSFSLQELVTEAIEFTLPQANKKGLTIDVHIPAEFTLISDRRRLLQCLTNYLSNSIKYSETGGATITVEQRENNVWMEVADTGIGIAEKDRPQIFEAFERLESHLRVKAGGSGLGLYLTRKIVTEILLGTVGFDSKEGAGSKFWLEIPMRLNTEDNILPEHQE